MKRYLLFDSGCALCTKVAREIEQETDGILVARSLRDPEVRAMLDEIKPGWQWEPMLIEITDGSNIKPYAGIQMKIRLSAILGIRRTWRVIQILRGDALPLHQARTTRCNKISW